MPVTDKERASFGFLGAPPPEIWNANREVTKRYKDLCIRARKVAKMKPSQRKLDLAKKIEEDYKALVQWARNAQT